MMLVTSLIPSVGAAPKPPVNQDPQFGSDTDDAAHPLGTQQREARALAFEAQMNGKTHGHTHQVHRRHYVELEREGEDTIWTIIGEFGSQIHPTYGGSPGPLHNPIPQPNRAVDNTTIWAPDFSKSYYEKLLFSEGRHDISMRKYYIEQSSNRYTVNGEV